METDEKQLILDAKTGNPRAFEILVERYDRQILSLAYDILGNVEDAQDVCQESLLSAYRAIEEFRMESAFSTWVYRIVVNKALNYKRRKSRLDSASNKVKIELARPAAQERSPEQNLLDAELQGEIRMALDTLSTQERMAFVLCHHKGFKMRETADLMACTEGSIKSYLFRAREKLKKRLTAYSKT